MIGKKVIAISAINFFEGGPLSVLRDCLHYVNNSHYQKEYKFIALVHDTKLFDKLHYGNIDFIEFPKSRKSYFYRLYYEYFYFKKFALINNVSFWLSLHDITPSLGEIPQAVYCHNPSPFNSINFKDIYLQPTQFFFRLFYKYLYQINIAKNQYIIVQQFWIKNKFANMFNIDFDKIIVAPPKINVLTTISNIDIKENRQLTFFYPTFPRPFKNIEIICNASKIVQKTHNNFKVIITVDGSENKYSNYIVKKYRDVSNVVFTGLITRAEVFNYYEEVDCLIFPSKLETWGLPITEFKQFNKSMLVADMPYAKETVGNYDFAKFFNADDPNQLAQYMIEVIENRLSFDQNYANKITQPYAQDWNELFTILLNK